MRITAVLLTLLAIQLGSLVAPAYACGCGALVPGDQREVVVGREVSAVRWDGAREQIVMRLTVGGDAERAAWIMPVPHRATVELGDPELFDQLAAATAPVHRTRHHFWPQDGDWPLTTGGDTAGAPPPGAVAGVGVTGRERLGPFDVARLTATDPSDLDDWLRRNGFALPARLAAALQPYVDKRWEYVAVRLVPESTGAALRGELEPLRLTFAADSLVYPMRLSRLAATPQSLGLYVLAAHRMEPASPIGGERPRVTFAGPVGRATGPLAALAKGTPYLTAVAQEFPRPSEISGDHELRRAAADTAYRQVIYEDRLLALAGIPVWLLTVVGAVAVLNAVAVVLGVRWGRAHRASAPKPRHASGLQPPAPPGTGAATAPGTHNAPSAPTTAGAAPAMPQTVLAAGKTAPTLPETGRATPGAAPKRPGTLPAVPRSAPTATGAAPATPGATPKRPGTPPAMPRSAPTATGAAPATPGAAPKRPGTPPAMPRSAPTTTGAAPATPGATPKGPGTPPAIPRAVPAAPGAAPVLPTAPPVPTRPPSAGGTPPRPVRPPVSSGSSLSSAPPRSAALQDQSRPPRTPPGPSVRPPSPPSAPPEPRVAPSASFPPPAGPAAPNG
ncbi:MULTISPECIES: DUF2330 domain-containing protein [unclassified Streptomyces]|uniref:DUF2330 domain-containing protein n=1 Tax=unclassified Streptomyces TaxID=2593676 RepID=UPI002E1F6E10|nr:MULTISPECIES: DUF2330 domain-containing protein [unclassified Streptomyces]